jgi:hypothetical protein
VGQARGEQFGPGPLLQPSLIAPTSDSQSGQEPLHGPAAAPLALFDPLMQAVFELRGNLAVIL